MSAEQMGQVQEEAQKEITLMKKFFDVVGMIAGFLIAGLCLFLLVFG